MLNHPLARAGLVLGVGFGGFFDGIVLHQILGWHHLVCRTETCQPLTVAMLQRQNTEDGLFHLAVWIVSLLGVALLFRARRAAGTARNLVGGLLAGWGAFNLVEGVVDHHLLKLHHVLPGSPHQTLYDLLFLASGALLLALGVALHRRAASPQSSAS